MDTEGAIRLAAFLGVLGLMLAWEWRAPARPLSAATTPRRLMRYGRNLSFAVLGTIIVRLIFPVLAVAAAEHMAARGFGLFNLIALPAWLEALLAFLVLDAVIWAQHLLFHSVPVFWRFHLMHHADLDFDTTTGVRFHPVEIALSMAIKLGVVALLGAPAVAVLAFEVVLNATAMFNHGNVRLPLWLDGILRFVIVTPDMHRVHHSIVARETNSNYGFNLSIWDRLARSYRAQPAAGHNEMTIGLAQYRDASKLTLPWLLALPIIAGTRLYKGAPRAHLGDEPGAILSGAAIARLTVFGLFLAGIGLAAYHRAELDVATIESWLDQFGALTPVVFIAIYAVSVTFFVPAVLFTLAGGMIFGPLWGTVFNLIAATLGAVIMALIARHLARDFVRARLNRWLKGVLAGVDEEGWRFVLLMRLIPGIPFAALNYALGLTRIGLLPYTVATLIGMVPAAIVLAYVGYAGRETALGGEAIGQKALIGLGALAALAILTRLALHLRRRSRAARGEGREPPRESP